MLFLSSFDWLGMSQIILQIDAYPPTTLMSDESLEDIDGKSQMMTGDKPLEIDRQLDVVIVNLRTASDSFVESYDMMKMTNRTETCCLLSTSKSKEV